MSDIALIPARSGSKRVPGKNIRELGGHPVIAYSIAAALDSGCFGAVVVSTDSEAYADVARRYGAEVPFLRSEAISGDLSPDIEWVEETLRSLSEQGRDFDRFSILRPTSPFRTGATIRRALEVFDRHPEADSLRAVELCKQHPGKMWVVQGETMEPLLPQPEGLPWHSSQYQALPKVYVQNASLEIAWTRVVFETGTIAGTRLVPFFTQGLEGFDVNREEDWREAEMLVARDPGCLPKLVV